MGWRRLLAEAIGTFGLTAVAAGSDIAGQLTGGEVTAMARAIAPGLFVLAFIYAAGDVSGMHINPAVTLGFTLERLFPAPWLVSYWLAQLAGAIAAGFALVALFGSTVAAAGVSQPHVDIAAALVIETFLSWALITVILGTADRARLIGPNAAVAVGGTIILCGLVAAQLSGASMNPARSTGPAVATGDLTDLWLYWVAPLLGAALAVVFTRLVHGPAPGDAKELEAAQGKGSG
jgi:aquaporin Z